MKRNDAKSITVAAEDALAAMRAARAATLAVQEALPSGGATAVQAAANQCDVVHNDAVTATQAFASKLQAALVKSVVSAVALATEKVRAASAVAQQLKTNAAAAAAPGAAPALLANLTPLVNALKQGDDEAVQRLADAEAAFKWSPEYEEATASRMPGWLQEFPFAEVGKWLTGVVLVGIAGLLLWQIKEATSGKNLLENLARADYARGLITFLLSAGTIVIGVLIVVAVLLGDGKEESQKKFGMAKEVLSVLVGIFGTILGFYFGTATTSQTASPLVLSPLAIARSADSSTTTIAGNISGGKPPYTFGITFKNDEIPAIKNQVSKDGPFTAIVSNVPAGKSVGYTVTVGDSGTNRLEYPAKEDQFIKGK